MLPPGVITPGQPGGPTVGNFQTGSGWETYGIVRPRGLGGPPGPPELAAHVATLGQQVCDGAAGRRPRLGLLQAWTLKAFSHPRFIFHSWFFMQNIQGGVRMTAASAAGPRLRHEAVEGGLSEGPVCEDAARRLATGRDITFPAGRSTLYGSSPMKKSGLQENASRPMASAASTLRSSTWSPIATQQLAARKVFGWSRRCKLAHALRWEHSYKRLKLAPIFLTCRRSRSRRRRTAGFAAGTGCPRRPRTSSARAGTAVVGCEAGPARHTNPIY